MSLRPIEILPLPSRKFDYVEVVITQFIYSTALLINPRFSYAALPLTPDSVIIISKTVI